MNLDIVGVILPGMMSIFLQLVCYTFAVNIFYRMSSNNKKLTALFAFFPAMLFKTALSFSSMILWLPFFLIIFDWYRRGRYEDAFMMSCFTSLGRPDAIFLAVMLGMVCISKKINKKYLIIGSVALIGVLMANFALFGNPLFHVSENLFGTYANLGNVTWFFNRVAIEPATAIPSIVFLFVVFMWLKLDAKIKKYPLMRYYAWVLIFLGIINTPMLAETISWMLPLYPVLLIQYRDKIRIYNKTYYVALCLSIVSSVVLFIARLRFLLYGGVL